MKIKFLNGFMVLLILAAGAFPTQAGAMPLRDGHNNISDTEQHEPEEAESYTKVIAPKGTLDGTDGELDISIASWYTVTGVVSDANTGWPLYAMIDIVQYPGEPIWTNPLDGSYSIRLPEGMAFTFNISPFIDGYLDASVTVDSLTGDTTQDFALQVDTANCVAPGYSGATCIAPSGGLVVGHVYDLDTSQALTNASVASTQDRVTSLRTPADPAVDDGLYVLYADAGSNNITATSQKRLGKYTPSTETVNVIAGMAINQNVYLDAGLLRVAPEALHVTVDIGMNTTLPITVSNTESGAAEFEIVEWATSFSSLQTSPNTFVSQTKEHEYLNGSEIQNTTGTDETSAINISATDVSPEEWPILAQWPTGDVENWGIGFDMDKKTIWVNDRGTGLNEEFTLDGVRTGAKFVADFGGSGTRDMTYNMNTGTFWQIGGDSCLYEWDPSIPEATGSKICSDAWSARQYGLTYDPIGDTFFVGGPYDQTIWHIDSHGTLIDSWDFSDEGTFGLNIAGLAYNFEAGLLFIQEIAPGNPITVLNVATGTIIHGFITYRESSGVGLAIDCTGNLWATQYIVNQVVLIDSGVPANLCPADLPWLSENPISGTISTSSNQVINVTFDADKSKVGQPGEYQARLRISGSPYGPVSVPVTMTVPVPPDYARLEGTVSVVYCSGYTNPLSDMKVVIIGNSTIYTLTTDADGYYGLWLDPAEGPLDISAISDGYTTSDEALGVIITATQTTTQDFTLRDLETCLEVEPTRLAVTLHPGHSTTLSLTLLNSGPVGTAFSISEASHIPFMQNILFVAPDESADLGAFMGELPYTYDHVTDEIFHLMTVDDLLCYSVVFYVSDTTPETLPSLIAYLDAGGRLYISDNDLGRDLGDTNFYKTYLQATYQVDLGGDLLAGESIMAGLGQLELLSGVDSDGFTVGAEGERIFTYPATGYAGGVAVERYGYKAVYTAFNFFDLDASTSQAEAADLIREIMEYLAPSNEIPWLSADPFTGTVAADSSQVIMVTFDAITYTMGTYPGNLLITDGDVYSFNDIIVPTTLTIGYKIYLPLLSRQVP